MTNFILNKANILVTQLQVAYYDIIILSLAYRLVGIVSDPATLDQRLAELKDLLHSREYRPRVIDAAIEKARAIPRLTALKKVVKTKNSKRVVATGENFHINSPVFCDKANLLYVSHVKGVNSNMLCRSKWELFQQAALSEDRNLL